MQPITVYIPCLVFAVILGHVGGAALTAEQFGRDLAGFLQEEFGNGEDAADPRGDGSSDWVYYGKRADTDPCDPNPCQNQATCTTAEQPLLGIGIDSYCLCKSVYDDQSVRTSYGGYFCEITDPCSNCPAGTAYCVPTSADADGRFCYDSDYRLTDTTSDISGSNSS